MDAADVIVVGGGMGGLAAALRLAAAGARVRLLERSGQLGGKMRTSKLGDYALDAGPTVLTMRTVFEDLFAAADLRLQDFVTLDPLETLARHGWKNGSTLDLFADPLRTAQGIDAFAGPREADGFRRFIKHAAKVYGRVEEPFIGAPKRPLVSSMLSAGIRGALAFARVDWHRSVWASLGEFFEDPRLRQLFARYATYVGSSPYQAPATLNVIAHVEQQGVWTVRGGMHQLAHALARVLEELGVEILTDTHVERIEIEAGVARGVVTQDGVMHRAAAVVFGGDPAALASGALGPSATGAAKAPATRSLSAVTFAWTAQCSGFGLDHHNVFFSNNYEREFTQLFGDSTIPTEPTVYVCAQARGPGHPPPTGSEPLLVLINAPAIGDRTDFEKEIPQCREATLRQLERCGLTVSSIEHEEVTTPRVFAERYPGSGGSLYGPATHSAMGAFSRPGHRSEVPGLYLVGGGAHPGAGVPMVTLSGRWAAEAIMNDLGSTFTSRPAATAGGT